MPFFLDRRHYQEIVALLTAGDIKATVLSVGEVDHRQVHEVEVMLSDGGRILWNNQAPWWTANRQDSTGKALGMRVTQIGWMATSEVVAEAIGLGAAIDGLL